MSASKTPPPSMNFGTQSALTPELAYLLEFLQDEFSGFEGVRIHPIFPSSTRRAPDLDQDYDAQSNDLHLRCGVRLRAGSLEEWFPVSWVREKRFDLVRRLAQEIRDRIEAR